MNAIIKRLRDLFKPPTWDSWQALILISLFSWAVTPLAQDSSVQTVIACGGWIFLIAGVHWALNQGKVAALNINVKESLTFFDKKYGLFLGPWITGALVCTFLKSLTNGPDFAYIVIWPTVSAIISALPKFVVGLGPKYGKPAPGVRQNLIILLLSNLILSCWLQLYFSTQDWVERYPNLLGDSFSRSSFLLNLNRKQRPVSRGVALLQQAESTLRDQLSNLSWPQVEQQLLPENRDRFLKSISDDAQSRLVDSQDRSSWQLTGQMLPSEYGQVLPGEYRMQLFAVKPPSVSDIGSYLKRTCQISRPNSLKSPTQPGVRVNCSAITGPTPGQPDLVSQ